MGRGRGYLVGEVGGWRLEVGTILEYISLIEKSESLPR